MSAVDVSQPNRMGVSTPGSTGGPSNPSFQQQRFDQNSRSNTPRDPYGRPIPPPNQSQQQAGIKPPQGQDGWPASSAAPPRRDWSQVDARSAAAAAQHAAAGSSLHRDHSPNPAYLVHSSPRTLHNQFGNSNPNDAGYQGGGAPPLAAPRAVQPYPRQLTSPQPLDNARSPSPSKRAQQGFNFTDNERWSSLGQSQQLGGGQAGGMGPASSFQPRKQPGLSFNTNGVDVGGQGLGIGQREGQGQNGIGGGQPQPQQGGAQRGPEPFLGYNDLIFGGSNRGQAPDGRGAAPPTDSQKAFAAAQQQQQLQQAAQARSFTLPPSHGEMDQYNSRFDGPPSAGFPREDGPYSAGPGGIREQLQYASGRGIGGMGPGGGIPGLPNSGSVSPRSLLHYHNQQIQAQQALAQQAAQIPLQAGLMGPPPGGIGPPEEITTVFIVGFPDDMTEREFANMFLFAKGFEASTLKIPAGGPSGPEPPQRNGMNGPGGPYNQVNMHGGLFDMNGPPMGAWDDPLSLAISRGNVDPLSLANLNSMNQGPNSMGLGPGGKIKQIIGFAKFRSRPEALEARDALNGRKIDAERGCVLKTEMAKKNLHTKQRPVLVGSNPALPNDFGPPSSNPMVAPSQPPFGMAQPPPNDRDRFPSSAGPASAGGFGGSRPPNFEPFPGSGGAQSHPNGMLSPGAEGYSNPSADFFGRGEASSFGGATSQASKLSQDGRASGDKWSSMGPLDYYAPDSSSQQQQASRQLPASNSYSSGAGGWPSREDFAKHESTSRNSDSPPNGDGSEGQASGHSQQKYEEALARHQQQQMLNIQQQQQQQQQFASRFGSMRLGADSPSNERPQDSNDSQSQSSPSNPAASFEQSQRQQQQQSSSSSHPHSHAASPSSTNATDLLQVTGFPSRPGSPEASHFEGELRHKFSEQPGFKNFSFQASQNGSSSNCLVEFSDVQSAARAMNALNGDTLNGILGQGGIRIGFARRENQFNDISGRDLVSISSFRSSSLGRLNSVRPNQKKVKKKF